MIKTGIIGGSRPVAGELIRLLLNHPDVDILWVHSKSNPGRQVAALHHRLIGQTDMVFSNQTPLENVDILFSCAEPGETENFINNLAPIPENLRIVDLADDFRHERPDNDFLYGLPEFNRKKIVRGAKRIANPGPVAIALELALLPAAKNLMLKGTVVATAFVGSTIVSDIPGRLPSMTDIALCQPTETADSEEIHRLIDSFGSQGHDSQVDLSITAVRGPFPRGIFATIIFESTDDEESVRRLYSDYYEDHNFTFVSSSPISLADVLGTNKCLIHIQKIGRRILATVAIDDLMKGSAGNAVHNMNLLFGLSERTGLE